VSVGRRLALIQALLDSRATAPRATAQGLLHRATALDWSQYHNAVARMVG